MAVALYSMAVVTFLPNCWIAVRWQRLWYDNGDWLKKENSGKGAYGKLKFIALMIFVTVISFVIRVKIVYDFYWADVIRALDGMLANSVRVGLAVLTPPLVDCIQAAGLIFAGLKTKEESRVHASELTESARGSATDDYQQLQQ
jgi:hypothetical protein